MFYIVIRSTVRLRVATFKSVIKTAYEQFVVQKKLESLMLENE